MLLFDVTQQAKGQLSASMNTNQQKTRALEIAQKDSIVRTQKARAEVVALRLGAAKDLYELRMAAHALKLQHVGRTSSILHDLVAHRGALPASFDEDDVATAVTALKNHLPSLAVGPPAVPAAVLELAGAADEELKGIISSFSYVHPATRMGHRLRDGGTDVMEAATRLQMDLTENKLAGDASDVGKTILIGLPEVPGTCRPSLSRLRP